MAFGTEFTVNSYITGYQNHPAVTTLSDGNFVVAWESSNQDSGTDGIYGQMYSAGGVEIGSEFLISSFPTDDQHTPSITALNNGGFVVTWQSSDQDGDDSGIYGQKYNADGSPNGGEFQINTYTDYDQYAPSVSALSSGGFVVTWQSAEQDGSGFGVFGKMYHPNGSPNGFEFPVNTYVTSAQHYSEVAGLSNGGFVVAWNSVDQDGDGGGIYGQMYHANGAVDGIEFQINSYTTSGQDTCDVTALTNGGFVVTWESTAQDGSGEGVFGQMYNASGAVMGAEFQVNTYTPGTQDNPTVTALSNGGFVVTWQSANQDGSGYGIFGQMYHGDGSVNGGEVQINTYTTSQQITPAVTAHLNGGFIVSWASSGQDGSGYAVVARMFFGEDDCNSITGGSGADELIGTEVADCMYGLAGADILDGQGGRDMIYGDAGRDELSGGKGGDYLYGGGARDTLDGEGGKDRLWGSAGNDVLDGGAGRDRLFGGGGADVLEGGAGNDILRGGGGADTFLFKSNHGDDTIKGFQDGVDIISFFSGAASMGDLNITQVGADVLVDYTSGTVLIENVLLANIDVMDFAF